MKGADAIELGFCVFLSRRISIWAQVSVNRDFSLDPFDTQNELFLRASELSTISNFHSTLTPW